VPKHQEFSDQVNQFFSGDYSVTPGYVIPNADDIQFGNFGRELDLAMLFIDLRESTKIVDGFRRQTAAKMYKSFLWGIAKIAREHGGELRSFNGDGVLVVFAGAERCEQAVTAAMQMSYFVQSILRPKVNNYIVNNRQLSNMSLSFGIGIDTGTVLVVRGGVRGENNNDLVWVGNATNYAVKLSNVKQNGHIRIMPSVYTALSDSNKFGPNVGLRVSMWHKANFPIQLTSLTPPINPSSSPLSFLATPAQPRQNLGLLGTMNALSPLTPPRPPSSYYYHTTWHREF
jgi:adenylate cyclase